MLKKNEQFKKKKRKVKCLRKAESAQRTLNFSKIQKLHFNGSKRTISKIIPTKEEARIDIWSCFSLNYFGLAFGGQNEIKIV